MAIARMDRVFIVGTSDHRKEAVSFLQEAGVVHVEAATGGNDDPDKRVLLPCRI